MEESLKKDIRDEVFNYVKKKGFALTREIAREFNLSSIIAGAILSELVSNGLIKVSYLKVGTGPLYYTDKRKLEDFVDYLNSKEKEAYNLIKKEKVVSDDELSPAMRVAMNSIKDFAVPVEVISSDNLRKRYWKYYLLDNSSVREFLMRKNEIQGHENGNKEELEKRDLIKEKNLKETRNYETRNYEKSSVEDTQKESVGLSGVNYEFGNKKKDNEKGISLSGLRSEEEANDFDKDTKEEGFLKEDKEKEKNAKQGFIQRVYDFLKNNDINIIDKEEIRKDREYNLIVSFPTSLGRLSAFCKCKNKKNINDNDISDAYVDALNKQMPLIYITNGKVTKKAEEALGKKFKSVILKRI